MAFVQLSHVSGFETLLNTDHIVQITGNGEYYQVYMVGGISHTGIPKEEIDKLKQYLDIKTGIGSAYDNRLAYDQQPGYKPDEPWAPGEGAK